MIRAELTASLRPERAVKMLWVHDIANVWR
jgi:hypothetical protein